MRLFLALSMILSAAAATAQEGQKPCRAQQGLEVRLAAHEFNIPAYDAERGLMVVQLVTELMPNAVRRSAIRLRMHSRQILLPIVPTTVSMGLERGLGDLEVVVEAEPTGSKETLAPSRPNCNDLKVRAVRLQQGSVVLSRRVIESEGKTPVLARIAQRVRLDEGEAEVAAIEPASAGLARRCLEQALTHNPTIQGALSLELSKTLLGDARSPIIVVDGLINSQLGYCLITSFAESDAIWSAIAPASRLYVDLYLRGEMMGRRAVPESEPEAEPEPEVIEAERRLH